MAIGYVLLLTLSLQTSVTPEVKAAQKLAKTAEAYAAKNPKGKRMFMLKGEKKWVSMKTDGDHLDHEIWREDVSLVAFTWKQPGKFTIVSFTGGSPSGDWTTNKVCTYRPNGLAHTNYHFGAFMFGGRSLDEETVFDVKGKKIYSKVTLTDLDGKARNSKEEKLQMLGSRPEIKDFLTISGLPFPR